MLEPSLEAAMEDKILSREEIALSLLSGIISTLSTELGRGALSHLGTEKDRLEACILAFQLADDFIQVRDKAYSTSSR
jgi:hypothetical protein